MAKDKARKRQKIKVHPSVYIKPGIEDLLYIDVYENEGGVTESGTGGALPVPETFIIEAQRIRVQPSGAHVVDVAIITDDFPGINQIDIRVTKENVT